MTTSRRRGMMLLAVMVVIVLASLIGSTLLVSVDAERSAAQTTLRRTQSRALAWSGVQYVTAQIAAQRERLLEGQEIEVDHEWVLYEEPTGTRAVVRLVPMGPSRTHLVSETGKIDINHASKEMLASLPGIGTEERAQRIIDARPFTSVEELVRVEGIVADVLYGFVDAPDPLGPGQSGPGEASLSSASESIEPIPSIDEFDGSLTEPSLIDLLTVFSFDPNVQAGIESPDKRGKLRVNLNVPWSDRFERAIEDQWGREAVAVVKQLFDSGMQFRSDRELIENVRRMGIEDVEIIRQIVDAVTTTDDMYRLGRVDILRASAAALAALPGIDATLAEEIIDLRDRLSDEARLSPMWLVDEGLITLDEYLELADLVTTRSMQWRVRIEAGFQEPAAYASQPPGVGESVLEGLAELMAEEAPLRDRVVYDVVVDVSSERPRVAYMREVTMLDLAQRLRQADVDERISQDQRAFEEALWAEMGLDELMSEESPLAGQAEDVRLADGPSWRSGSRIDQRRADRANRSTERLQARRSRLQEVPQAEPEPTMPGDPVDRRIGRWRAGGER